MQNTENSRPYPTIHDESLGMVKFLGVCMLIYIGYRFVKCLFAARSLTRGLVSAVLDGGAPVLIAMLLIAMLVYFTDWALYTAWKNRALRAGNVSHGTMEQEIEHTHLRGGSTYRYAVRLADGSTVKSHTYRSRITDRACTVYRYAGGIVLSPPEDHTI